MQQNEESNFQLWDYYIITSNKYRHYICIMYILYYHCIYYKYTIANLFQKGKK